MPCYWVREERGIAYEGWVGPVFDSWRCLHHGHTISLRRTPINLMALKGFVEMDDLLDTCGGHEGWWISRGWG